MTDADAGRTPYQQVVAAIRRQITAGHLKPGDRLPSQRALADQYQIAPMTAAKAVRALCDSGWAVSAPSYGVFVTEPPKTEPPPNDPGSLADQLDELRLMVHDLARRIERIETELRPVDAVDS
jgi:GntR family transcriptional regulator